MRNFRTSRQERTYRISKGIVSNDCHNLLAIIAREVKVAFDGQERQKYSVVNRACSPIRFMTLNNSEGLRKSEKR